MGLQQMKASMESQMDDLRQEMRQFRQAQDEDMMSGSRKVGVQSNAKPGQSLANELEFQAQLEEIKTTTDARFVSFMEQQDDESNRLEALEDAASGGGGNPGNDNPADLQSLRNDFESIREVVESMNSVRADVDEMEEGMSQLALEMEDKYKQQNTDMKQINDDFKSIEEA